MIKKILVFSVGLIIGTSSSWAEKKDLNILAIKGATLVSVVQEDIVNGTLLIKDGLIENMGENIEIPKDAKIIDASGLYAYPGMIDGYCFLGLEEIRTVRATVDIKESGRINPQLQALEALFSYSMHIPISMSNGITAALVAPAGGLIAGQSCLIRLAGWTREEMLINSPTCMHIYLPPMRRPARHFSAEQDEQTSKQIEELKKLFNQARFYQKRKNAAKKNLLLALPEFNETYESLLPVVNRDLPVMISVHAAKDILDAIKFVKEENIKAIFFGVTQGWRVADEIKKSGIPVVFGSLYTVPTHWEDGYDAIFRNPGVLQKAGVKFAFSSQSASMAKDLPYQAARAAAFGLDKREALKGVTIYPAQIFGIDDKLGSLEKGKVANIVIADGDILELRTKIKYIFINGIETDLSNRYTELLEKYGKRYK